MHLQKNSGPIKKFLILKFFTLKTYNFLSDFESLYCLQMNIIVVDTLPTFWELLLPLHAQSYFIAYSQISLEWLIASEIT